MSNEKEGLDVNSISSSIGSFSYKSPAIMITERNGGIEKVFEFATAEDYAAYKRIEDGHRGDEMRRVECAEIAKICEESLNPCYWAHMRRKNNI